MKRQRRKYPRQRLAGNTFFVLDQCSTKLAMLSDLGAGGMQLSYSPGEAIGHQWTSVNIVTRARPQVLISGLVCKTIYDVASLMENGSFSGADIRICGIRFDSLTYAQKQSLDMLLASVASA